MKFITDRTVIIAKIEPVRVCDDLWGYPHATGGKVETKAKGNEPSGKYRLTAFSEKLEFCDHKSCFKIVLAVK